MRISSKVQKILLALLLMVVLYVGMAAVLKAIGLENAQNYVKQAGVWAPVLFVDPKRGQPDYCAPER